MTIGEFNSIASSSYIVIFLLNLFQDVTTRIKIAFEK